MNTHKIEEVKAVQTNILTVYPSLQVLQPPKSEVVYKAQTTTKIFIQLYR